MATDRRILRIDLAAQAQQRIAAAVSSGAIVAAEGNLLWCRDTKTLSFIGPLVGGAYLLTAVGDAAAAEAAREAAETVRPIAEGDGLLILPRLDGRTLRVLYPTATITATDSTYTLRGRVLPTIVFQEKP